MAKGGAPGPTTHRRTPATVSAKGAGIALMPGKLTPLVSPTLSASGLGIASGTLAATTGGISPPSSDTYSVLLDFGGGSTLTFNSADAVDLGDFVGEHVRQKCSVVVSTDKMWRVYFRPDANGLRDEVVVEYGRGLGGIRNGPNITSPYTATIAKNGTQVYSVTVPVHWYLARWRWQSAQRTVVRPTSELRSRKWIPNYQTRGLANKPVSTHSMSYAGPFQPIQPVNANNKSIYINLPGMGSGGDGNDQIGPLTENAAEYMIRPSSALFTTLMAEGEAWGLATFHTRADDGSMLDIVAGHLFQAQYTGGTLSEPTIPADYQTNTIWVGSMGGEPDTSHLYPCPMAGWLLTEDPYLLEEMQFAAQWQLISASWMKAWGRWGTNQSRTWAWSLRDMLMCHQTTPLSVPRWLLPKSFWANVLDVNRAWAEQSMNSPARVHSYFRAFVRCDFVDTWMTAWVNIELCRAVEMGYEEWRPLAEWAMGQTIAMTNGTSGWNWQYPAPYGYVMAQPGAIPLFTTVITDTSKDAATFADWAECWNYYVTDPDRNDVPIDPVLNAIGPTAVSTAGWDGHTIMHGYTPRGVPPVGGPIAYINYLRAALAQARTIGMIDETQASWDHIDGEFLAYYNTQWLPYVYYGQARYAIDPVAVDTSLPDWASLANLPAGTYKDIPTTNTPSSVQPSYYSPFADGLFNNWSSGHYTPEFSSPFGAMVFEGGGHAGNPTGFAVTQHNGKLILDLSTLTWSFTNAGTKYYAEDSAPDGSDARDYYGQYPDGSVESPHINNGMQAFPTAWGGGPKGSSFRMSMVGSQRQPQDYNTGWAADLSQPLLGWTKLVPIMQLAATGNTLATRGAHGNSAIDIQRKGWWFMINQNSDRIVFVNTPGGTVTTYLGGGCNTSGSTFTRDPVRDVLVRMDTTPIASPVYVYELNCAAPTSGWVRKNVTLDPVTIASRTADLPYNAALAANNLSWQALEWSTILGHFVFFCDGNGVDQPGAPLNCPYVWHLEYAAGAYTLRKETLTPVSGTGVPTYAISSGGAPIYNGSYGRFREVPLLRCFVYAASGTQKPQAWRLQGM